MKKWVVYGVFALAVGFGTWKFWSLGSIPVEMPAGLRLSIEHPGVEVRRAGSENWVIATDGMDLYVGDTVHTDGDGNATLHLFGRGESRLGKKTETTIRIADQDSNTGLRMNLVLVTGRLWSRIRRFTDLDERFQVENNGVVATVRGTAFDLQASSTSTSVWVSESAVALEGKGAHRLLMEGYMVSAKPDGTLGREEPITDESRQAEWFQKNTNRDQAFEVSMRASLEQSYRDRGGAKPQTISEGLTRLSEWLHLTLSSADDARLYSGYIGRRLYHLAKIMEQGNDGLGLQEYANLEDEVLQRLKTDEGKKYRIGIQHEIESLAFLLSNVGPRSKAYRLKQRLEDLRVKLADDAPITQAHARVLAVEARLDEASDLIVQSSLDDAKTALDAAKQGTENVTHDLERMPSTPAPKPEELSALRDKLQLLRNREAGLRVRLATAIAPPTPGIGSADPWLNSGAPTSTATTTISASSTSPIAPTSTSPVTPTTTTPIKPPEKPPEAKPTLQALRLQPGSANLAGGQSVSFKAMAIYSDGTSVDVTSLSILSASNLRLGFILRDAFTANPGMDGSVDIGASYTEAGHTVRASSSVVIHP